MNLADFNPTSMAELRRRAQVRGITFSGTRVISLIDRIEQLEAENERLEKVCKEVIRQQQQVSTYLFKLAENALRKPPG